VTTFVGLLITAWISSALQITGANLGAGHPRPLAGWRARGLDPPVLLVKQAVDRRKTGPSSSERTLRSHPFTVGLLMIVCCKPGWSLTGFSTRVSKVGSAKGGCYGGSTPQAGVRQRVAPSYVDRYICRPEP
jgi:hypothetical protein